jgi:hypothetical protein
MGKTGPVLQFSWASDSGLGLGIKPIAGKLDRCRDVIHDPL